MRDHIQRFLSYLGLEQSASGNTVLAYRNDLGQFLNFAEKQAATPDSAIDPVKIDRNLILSYVLSLKQRNYAPATIARKMAAIRALFAFLHHKGVVKDDPTADLEMARVNRSLPKSMSTHQVRQLLEQTARGITPEARRDRAMLELLYATGLRVSELMSLDLNDVDMGARQLHCSSRQSKERYISFGEESARALGDYIEAARLRLARDGSQRALFLNRRGERLTRQGFWQILKGYAKAARLDMDITPRTLRHSIATHLLLSGTMDVNQLSTFLGHASVATTQVYNQMASQHVQSPSREK